MAHEHTEQSLDAHELIERISDPRLRSDCQELLALLKEVTGQEPVLWGPSIIGFGRRSPQNGSADAAHNKCVPLNSRTVRSRKPNVAEDGLEIGFSPRSNGMALCLRRYADHYADFVARMGEVHSGRVCISFESLDAVDRNVLRELITYAWEDETRGE